MGTLSKSLASCGGYIAGAAPLIEYLRYSVPGFVYSVGITPANAAAAGAALETMLREPDRVTRLHLNADSFLAKAHALGLETGLEQAYAVVPVMVGDEELAVRLSAGLLEQGVDVQAAIFPAVPEGQARLRFFITSEHSAQQIDEALTKAAHTLAELRLQQGG